MPITEYPQQIQKSTNVYINAGTTYAAGYQTSITGTISLDAPNKNVTNSSASGTGYCKWILSGNATITFNTSTLPASYGHMWYVEIANPSTYTVAWTGITWAGTAPTQTTNGRSIYQFFSPDGGTTIYGKQLVASLAGTN